ncbi:hypothetical protein [Streptomyces sp. NPDC001546]
MRTVPATARFGGPSLLAGGSGAALALVGGAALVIPDGPQPA